MRALSSNCLYAYGEAIGVRAQKALTLRTAEEPGNRLMLTFQWGGRTCSFVRGLQFECLLVGELYHPASFYCFESSFMAIILYGVN